MVHARAAASLRVEVDASRGGRCVHVEEEEGDVVATPNKSLAFFPSSRRGGVRVERVALR